MNRKKVWKFRLAYKPVTRSWEFTNESNGDGHNVLRLRLHSLTEDGREAVVNLSPEAADLLAAHLIAGAAKARQNDDLDSLADIVVAPHDPPYIAPIDS